VSESPIDALLRACDSFDVDGMVAMAAPECRLLTADGHRAEGRDAVRQQLERLVHDLRSTSHRIVSEWHHGDVWIAEVEADYELRDWLQIKALPRAFFLHVGPEGITEIHVYGAHELPIAAQHRTGEEGMWLGDRWIPPL
jgi:ketosteroid isomerase-like protein